MGKSRGRHLGLLALRVGVGATLAAHGSQKLLGCWAVTDWTARVPSWTPWGSGLGKVSALLAGLGECWRWLPDGPGLATPLGGAAQQHSNT